MEEAVMSSCSLILVQPFWGSYFKSRGLSVGDSCRRQRQQRIGMDGGDFVGFRYPSDMDDFTDI